MKSGDDNLNTTIPAAMRAILAGVGCLGRAETRRVMWLGVAVYGVSFVILIDGVLALTFWATSGWVEAGSGWGAVAWVTRVAAVVSVGVMAPAIYVLIGAIVMPVLKGRIFRSARHAAGAPPDPSALSLRREVNIEVRRLGRFVFFTVTLLPLNLMPSPWGTVAFATCEFVLSAHTLGWDLLAYHFEIANLSYRRQRQVLAANRPLVLAVGAIAALLMLIPVLHALFVSTNVAGAGLLSARLDAGHE